MQEEQSLQPAPAEEEETEEVAAIIEGGATAGDAEMLTGGGSRLGAIAAKDEAEKAAAVTLAAEEAEDAETPASGGRARPAKKRKTVRFSLPLAGRWRLACRH